MYEKVRFFLGIILSNFFVFPIIDSTANKNNNKNDMSVWWNGKDSVPIQHMDICCAFVFQLGYYSSYY